MDRIGILIDDLKGQNQNEIAKIFEEFVTIDENDKLVKRYPNEKNWSDPKSLLNVLALNHKINFIKNFSIIEGICIQHEIECAELYSIFDNEILDTEKVLSAPAAVRGLELKAQGLYTYLSGFTGEYPLIPENLATYFGEELSTIENLLVFLEENGLLLRVYYKEDNFVLWVLHPTQEEREYYIDATNDKESTIEPKVILEEITIDITKGDIQGEENVADDNLIGEGVVEELISPLVTNDEILIVSSEKNRNLDELTN